MVVVLTFAYTIVCECRVRDGLGVVPIQEPFRTHYSDAGPLAMLDARV